MENWVADLESPHRGGELQRHGQHGRGVHRLHVKAAFRSDPPSM